MFSIGEAFCLFLLLVFAWWDTKQREFDKEIIVITFFAGLTIMLTYGEERWLAYAGGIAIGLLFLLIAKLTEEKIGYGDGMLILLVGMNVGIKAQLQILAIAFSLLFIAGIAAFFLRRKWKHMRLPFVPFLLLGDVAVMAGKAWEVIG